MEAGKLQQSHITLTSEYGLEQTQWKTGTQANVTGANPQQLCRNVLPVDMSKGAYHNAVAAEMPHWHRLQPVAARNTLAYVETVKLFLSKQCAEYIITVCSGIKTTEIY